MIEIFNTLSGQKERFEPVSPPNVLMYVCGPTVYDDAHIGHGRAYVVYDTIARYLRHREYQLKYVRNITDIDDKIIARANQERRGFDEVAAAYANSFREDMQTLGLVAPDVEPKATETVEEIVRMVETLIRNGHAYEAGGDVYFSVSSQKDYGKLSKKKLKELKAGARVDPNEQKKDPLDFALWKKAKEGEPFWKSPWSDGRPGWHIECSAMSKKFLAETIDIHAGGRDLIFPHHENEIAQSEAASGKTFVKYWIHNGFVNLDKEKMSKSLGNTLTLKKLFSEFHPEALKLFLLNSHYRSPIDFSDGLVRETANGLNRLYRVLLSVPDAPTQDAPDARFAKEFEDAMDDDFNSAKALAVLFDASKEANRLQLKKETLGKAIATKNELVRLGKLLGFFSQSPEVYFKSLPGMADVDVSYVEKKIADRAEARRNKDFREADGIREELSRKGIVLEDGPEGTSWRLQNT